MKTLLVIDTQNYNWFKLFEGEFLKTGDEIKLEQASWSDIRVTSYSDSSAYCNLSEVNNPIKGSNQHNNRIVKPDFLLVRNMVKEPLPKNNYSNTLFGLLHANIPSMNSLISIYSCLERPVVYGALKSIRDKLGKEIFPLIDQTYYSEGSEIIVTPSYPLVAKVGHSHAGFGKMRFTDHSQMEDFRSVIIPQNTYITLEEYFECDSDIRIQKLGSHYRVFERSNFHWKKNEPGSSVKEIQLEKRYKLWVDECSKLFGGLDILALDVLVTSTGKEIILELNDSAIGLNIDSEKDMNIVKEMVIHKMNFLFNQETEYN